MSDILDTARELLALLTKARGVNEVAALIASRDVERLLSDATTGTLCRALIARTEALRELVACKDLNERALSISPIEPGFEREILMDEWRWRQPRAWKAARKALSEEPQKHADQEKP